MTDKFQNDIKNLIEEFNFNGHKKFKLIVLFGLLGDFDSFEYAINLKSFIDKNQDKNLHEKVSIEINLSYLDFIILRYTI